MNLKFRRLVSIILCIGMVLGNNGISVLADSIGNVIENSVEYESSKYYYEDNNKKDEESGSSESTEVEDGDGTEAEEKNRTDEESVVDEEKGESASRESTEAEEGSDEKSTEDKESGNSESTEAEEGSDEKSTEDKESGSSESTEAEEGDGTEAEEGNGSDEKNATDGESESSESTEAEEKGGSDEKGNNKIAKVEEVEGTDGKLIIDNGNDIAESTASEIEIVEPNSINIGDNSIYYYFEDTDNKILHLSNNSNSKKYSSFKDSGIDSLDEDVKSSIEKVVIDDEIRPVTCASWFKGATNLTEIENIASFNTEDVTDMKEIFMGCSSIKVLNLGSFDTAKVTDMTSMFEGCEKLEDILVTSGKFVTTKVTASTDMFKDCYKLCGMIGTRYSNYGNQDVTYAKIDGGWASGPRGYFCNVTTPRVPAFWRNNEFKYRPSDAYITSREQYYKLGLAPGWYEELGFSLDKTEITKIKVLNETMTRDLNKSDITETKKIYIYVGDTEVAAYSFILKGTELYITDGLKDDGTLYGFAGGKAFATLIPDNMADISGLYEGFTNVEEILAYNCNRKEYAGQGANFWHRVVKANNLFKDCHKLKNTNIRLSNRICQLKEIEGLFENCYEISDEAVNGFFGNPKPYTVSGWNYCAPITNAKNLFKNCQALTNIDLNSINTSKTTDMTSMFEGCINLETIKVSSYFVTTAVEEASDMFYNCSKLADMTGTVFEEYVNKEKEASSLRNMQEFDWKNYKGKEKFYDNGNEWNEYNKQLWEFHEIREAWEDIYGWKDDGKLKEPDKKVNVLVVDNGMHVLGKVGEQDEDIIIDENKIINGEYIIDEDYKNTDLAKIYNAKMDAKDCPAIFFDGKDIDADKLHGSIVGSIIGYNFLDQDKATRSYAAGIAKGYDNSLSKIYLFDRTESMHDTEVNEFLNSSKNNNTMINVVNGSFSLVTEKPAFGLETIKDNPHTSFILAAGNRGREIDYNLIGREELEDCIDTVKAYDEAILVGALQGVNGDIGYDSSETKEDANDKKGFADCYYYADYTNRGERVDLYACAHHDTYWSAYTEPDRLEGTSFATPVVSGIVALMYKVNPDLNARQVKNILYKTSEIITERGTKDKIRVIKAKKAVEEAKKLADGDEYYDKDNTEVVFKKRNFVINDISNSKYSKEVYLEENEYNWICIPRPYFMNCSIDNFDRFEWRIKSIDGEKFEILSDDIQSKYSIKDDTFFVNGSYDGEEKFKKHIVELMYVEKNNNEEYKEKGKFGYSGGITIEIYPNERIARKVFRESESMLGLGASALINPYKFINSYSVAEKGFAGGEFNYDKIKIVAKVKKENDGEIGKEEFTSNVLEVNDEEVVMLPRNYDVDTFVTQNKIIKEMKMYGLNKEHIGELTKKYIGNSKSGFSNLVPGNGVSAFSNWVLGSDNYLKASNTFNDYKAIGFYWDQKKEYYVYAENGKIKQGQTHLEGVDGEKYTINTTTSRFDNNNNHGISRTINIPKSNILYTIDHYNGYDIDTNVKELVIIPEKQDEEFVAINNEKLVIHEEVGKNKNKYRIDDIDVSYNKSSPRQDIRFKIMVFGAGSDVKHVGNEGYTSNNEKNIIEKVFDMQQNSCKLKNIYSMEQNDITENDLINICKEIDKGKKCYLFIEKEAEDYTKVATKLVRIKKDKDNEEKASFGKVKVKVGEKDTDVSKETIIEKTEKKKIKKVKEEKKCCSKCIVFGLLDYEIFGTGEEEIPIITLRNLLKSAGIEQTIEGREIIGVKLTCGNHGIQEVIKDLDTYIMVEGNLTVEVMLEEEKTWAEYLYNMFGGGFADEFYKGVKFKEEDNWSFIRQIKSVGSKTIEAISKTPLTYDEELKAPLFEQIDLRNLTEEEEGIDLSTYGGVIATMLKNKGNVDKREVYKTINEMTDSEVSELKEIYEAAGFDTEKMMVGKANFKEALRSFIKDTFLDYTIMSEDYKSYVKVDLRDLIPTSSEIISKNFEKMVDKDGKEIESCYLDETIDIVTSEPISVSKNKGYKVEIGRAKGGYLYKYKAEEAGKYNVVTYNNGELDPYIEVYRLNEEGDIDETTYVADDDSLYNRNAIIKLELKKGEEVYVRCSMADDAIGEYEVSVVDDREGKTPAIGTDEEYKLMTSEPEIMDTGKKYNGKTIEDLEIGRYPYKTTYYKGNWDKFDPAGLSIDVFYSDNTKERIAYNDSTKRYFIFGDNIIESSKNTGFMSFTYNGVRGNIALKLLDPEDWIGDIVILEDREAVTYSSRGYEKLNVDLNAGTRGKTLYLWYKITNNKNLAIKDLKLSFSNRVENMPDYSSQGWTTTRRDLNEGAGGDCIYLWYTTEGEMPIRQLDVEALSRKNEDKAGWNTARGVRSTVINGNTNNGILYSDLNNMVSGKYVYLRYRY